MSDNGHWPLFKHFVATELGYHGPDPQIELMAELARMHECDITETAWMVGCYGAHHCVPSAFVIWQHHRPHDVVEVPQRLFDWLMMNWEYLPVRPEMRSSRMVEKRHECLTDFARYAISYKPGMSYEERWFDSQQRVKYYGRYMAIKVLEMWRRMIPDPALAVPDLRARGGWSPRRALFLLWPNNTILGNAEDHSKSAAQAIELAARDTKDKLAADGINVSFFQLQVLLCEYRELLNGGFYPGAGHDEEMDYIKITARKFDTTPIYLARKHIFQSHILGELNNWQGLRKDRFGEWKAKGEAQFGYRHY